MRLTELRPLFRSMQALQVTRHIFDYRVRRGEHAIAFNVAFLIEDSPFTLMFGCRVHNIFFKFAVRRGFEIDLRDLSADTMKQIRGALGLQWNVDAPYTPTAFMEEFRRSGQIPTEATRDPPRPDRMPVPPSAVEEGERIYFVSWRLNGMGRHVTPENLEKTRLLIGPAFAEICAAHNISSCWSATPTDRNPVGQPPVTVTA